MAHDLLRETFAQGLGEVALQDPGEVGVIGHVGAEDLGVEVHLGIGRQHRELRTGEAAAGRLAFREARVVGQELQGAL